MHMFPQGAHRVHTVGFVPSNATPTDAEFAALGTFEPHQGVERKRKSKGELCDQLSGSSHKETRDVLAEASITEV